MLMKRWLHRSANKIARAVMNKKRVGLSAPAGACVTPAQARFAEPRPGRAPGDYSLAATGCFSAFSEGWSGSLSAVPRYPKGSPAVASDSSRARIAAGIDNAVKKYLEVAGEVCGQNRNFLKLHPPPGLVLGVLRPQLSR
jgi:hypothetical protein